MPNIKRMRQIDSIIKMEETDYKVFRKKGGWDSTLWQSSISRRNPLHKDNTGNGV